MNTLGQLQAEFKNHLMRRDSRITDAIVGGNDVGRHPRLAIYRHAYYARLEEALAQDYSAVHSLLGDEAFSELCQRYADTCPSTSASLRWFGSQMSEFLRAHAPYAQHPALAELARLEWLLVSAFDAADAAIATVADAAGLASEHWPQLRIALHPSVHWDRCRWNILPLWQAASAGEELPELQPLAVEQHYVVWRQDLVTRFRSLDSDEHALLVAAAAGETFAGLCEHLAALGLPAPQVPARAAALLKTWLSQGLVAQLR